MNKKKKAIIKQSSTKSFLDKIFFSKNEGEPDLVIDQTNKLMNHNNKLNIEFFLQIIISIIIFILHFKQYYNSSNNNNNNNNKEILIILSSIINIILQIYLHHLSKYNKINNKSIIQRPLVSDWGLSLSISLLPNVLLVLLYNINYINSNNSDGSLIFKIDLVLFYLLSISIISPFYLLNYLSLSSDNNNSNKKSTPPLQSINSNINLNKNNNKIIIIIKYLIPYLIGLIVLVLTSYSGNNNNNNNSNKNHNNNNIYNNFLKESILLQLFNIIYIIVCKQLLEKLTSSFTIGEASIISQFLTILISESLRYCYNLLNSTSINNNNNSGDIQQYYKFNNLNILYCFYSLILGSLLVVSINTIFGIASNLRKYVISTRFTQSPMIVTKNIQSQSSSSTIATANTTQSINQSKKSIIRHKFSENKIIISKTIQFYLLVLGVIFLIIYPVLSYQVNQNPFEWVFQYIGSSKEIMWLMIIWSVMLILTIILYQPSIHSEIPMIISRKYFHILAVVMFTPPLLFFPSSGSIASLSNQSFQMNTFMVLSFAVSISALVLLELLKYSMAPPLAEPIKVYMDRFLDSRDSGIITLTHLYLLLGCSIPLFLTFFIDLLNFNNNSSVKPYHLLSPFSGLLTIGVGDTMASYFGVKYGKTKWFGSSHKSIEGTIAGSIFTILISIIIYYFTNTPINIVFSFYSLIKIIFASTICSFIEASTNQIDNLILPLFYFILINL